MEHVHELVWKLQSFLQKMDIWKAPEQKLSVEEVLIFGALENRHLLAIVSKIIDQILERGAISIQENGWPFGFLYLLKLLFVLKHLGQLAVMTLTEHLQASHELVGATDVQIYDFSDLLIAAKCFERLNFRKRVAHSHIWQGAGFRFLVIASWSIFLAHGWQRSRSCHTFALSFASSFRHHSFKRSFHLLRHLVARSHFLSSSTRPWRLRRRQQLRTLLLLTPFIHIILLLFLFSYLICIYLRLPLLKFDLCLIIFFDNELVVLLYLLIYSIILLNLVLK